MPQTLCPACDTPNDAGAPECRACGKPFRVPVAQPAGQAGLVLSQRDLCRFAVGAALAGAAALLSGSAEFAAITLLCVAAAAVGVFGLWRRS